MKIISYFSSLNRDTRFPDTRKNIVLQQWCVVYIQRFLAVFETSALLRNRRWRDGRTYKWCFSLWQRIRSRKLWSSEWTLSFELPTIIKLQVRLYFWYIFLLKMYVNWRVKSAGFLKMFQQIKNNNNNHHDEPFHL